MRLCVSDDGTGFNPEEVPTSGLHCGLLSMQERIAQIGGALQITSRSGSGTLVRGEIPCVS